MKIDNVKIYGLEASIVGSGLPMVEDYDADSFDEDATRCAICSHRAFLEFKTQMRHMPEER